MAKEQLGAGGSEGTVGIGLGREVLLSGSARTLTSAQSGALVLINHATALVTLPSLSTATIGMRFDFIHTLAATGTKVITAVPASQFLVGNIAGIAVTTLATTAGFAAAGTSSTVSIISNGTTTGGLIGSTFTVTAISTTQWAVSGIEIGSGTMITSIAAS